MTRVVEEVTLDAPELADLLADASRPRRGLVVEREAPHGQFEGVRGPVHAYRRTISITSTSDGRARLRQTVEYRLAVPFFGWLLELPCRHELRRLRGRPAPWWAPTDPVDARASVALASLAVLSIITGYLATLLSQTVTFAAREFGTGTAAQGVALAAVRADFVIAFAVVVLADRRGRRTSLLAATTAGCAATVTGVLAPSLAWLTLSQIVARGFVTAAAVIVAIAAVEEVPAGSRAWALSLLALTGGLGAGLCVMALPLADLGLRSWRALYALPVLGLPAVAAVARRLPESRRFHAPARRPHLVGHAPRLWMLALSAFLLAVFVTPASQFQNEYLRDERGFSAGQISLFALVTSTPTGIGILAGGHLADRYGRRRVGALAVVGGTCAVAASYLASGWALWAWSLAGSTVVAASVPALGVYGPELFPTALRGRANGAVTGLGRVGSVVGVLSAGFLSAEAGHFGPALAMLAVGPVILGALVLALYPETAGLELEELNPEDAAQPGPAELSSSGDAGCAGSGSCPCPPPPGRQRPDRPDHRR